MCVGRVGECGWRHAFEGGGRQASLGEEQRREGALSGPAAGVHPRACMLPGHACCSCPPCRTGCPDSRAHVLNNLPTLAAWPQQVLVHTLLSRQPRLRKAAADTLRHLAERDAQSVLAEQIEPALFAALDSETGVCVCVVVWWWSDDMQWLAQRGQQGQGLLLEWNAGELQALPLRKNVIESHCGQMEGAGDYPCYNCPAELASPPPDYPWHATDNST